MTGLGRLLVSVSFLVLTGCGSLPKTPELLIQNAKDEKMFSDKDTFDVNRSIAQVADVLKKKSGECLQQTLATTSRQNGLTRREVIEFTPRVIVDKDRVRLTLQSKAVDGRPDLAGPPPDGWYMMVVDAHPIGKNTTHVETHFQNPSQKAAIAAVRLWLTGKNMGCPDLTQ